MQIYHYHPDTYEYTGTGLADESPLEPGIWLIPANATQMTPPTAPAGTVRRFVGGSWIVEAVDQPDNPLDPDYEPSLEDIFAAKMAAIQAGKNAARDRGFTLDGVLYDTDAEARLAYLELATKLAQDPTYTTPWKASAGRWVTMDAALFAALQPVYEAHVQSCFGWQAEREQELAAAYAAGDRSTMEAVAEAMG